jgi:hypothetical protein
VRRIAVSGGVKDAGKHYFGLRRLQAEKLYEQQKQKDQSGSSGVEKILPVLQGPDCP